MSLDSPALVKPGVTPASLTAQLQPERPRARTTQANVSQIPGPQELCKIIDVCCYKLLTLRVICYTAVDNNMARHSGHLRGVIVAREVDIILDEHSEVFSTVQERRPE